MVSYCYQEIGSFKYAVGTGDFGDIQASLGLKWQVGT